jgi:hypothetical protein
MEAGPAAGWQAACPSIRGVDQHLAEGAKHFPHLGLFVGKDIDGIHGVNGHPAIHLEN